MHFSESLARLNKYAKYRSKQSFDLQPSFQRNGLAVVVNNLYKSIYHLPSGNIKSARDSQANTLWLGNRSDKSI